jgi:hypothetical protein
MSRGTMIASQSKSIPTFDSCFLGKSAIWSGYPRHQESGKPMRPWQDSNLGYLPFPRHLCLSVQVVPNPNGPSDVIPFSKKNQLLSGTHLG